MKMKNSHSKKQVSDMVISRPIVSNLIIFLKNPIRHQTQYWIYFNVGIW